MKFKQLRYIWEVAHHNLNVSSTAQTLFTSQPGISKQIRLLEDELGVEIFSRNGKHLKRITPAGEKIINITGEILRKMDGIKKMAQEFCNKQTGCLSIAATHTQNRYILPSVLKNFITNFPDISLKIQHIQQNDISHGILENKYDFVIFSEKFDNHKDIIILPCFYWELIVVIPHNHHLANNTKLQIQDLVGYPLITYPDGCNGHTVIHNAFAQSRAIPQIKFTSTDTNVIKNYVKMNLGVGIIAKMEYNPERDHDLKVLDTHGIFDLATTLIAFHKGMFLRSYMYSFIELVAPYLTKDIIDKTLNYDEKSLNDLLTKIKIPIY